MSFKSLRGVAWPCALLAIPVVGLATMAIASQDFEVSIPRSELSPPAHLGAAEGGPSSALGSLEVGVSSWAPSSLSPSSRLDQAGSFGRTAVPALLVSWQLPSFYQGRRVEISLTGGVGFEGLRREGYFTADESSARRSISQNLYLVVAQLGLESSYRVTGPLRIYGEVGVRPSLALLSQSAMDYGGSFFGVPAQLALGSAWDLGGLGDFWTGKRVKVGAEATLGRWTSEDFQGVGATAALSFDL